MKTYRIEDWDVYFGSLLGVRVEDDKPVTTSRVQSFAGNVVTTKNSTYTLGKPSVGFTEYCKYNDVALDMTDFAKAFEKLGMFDEED